MATSELTGKTVLLTGGTDGLGRALAVDLAARGATLLLHGRDEERAGTPSPRSPAAPVNKAWTGSSCASR